MLTLKEKLQRRAKALSQTRAFFDRRGFVETDVATCSKGASVDAYIDLFEVKGEGYLHSSPELRMKDLLSGGSGDIYFLGHVFRKEEVGSMHNSEFTMLEYYRTNTTEEVFLNETIDYLSLFLGNRKKETLTYSEAMEKYAPSSPPEIDHFTEEEKRHYLFSHLVEPNLGKNCYTIIKDFPAEEASLAQTEIQNGKTIAKRFELFADATELANGFYELSCAKMARLRFNEANTKRAQMNKPTYPLDEEFLTNLERGLPPGTYGIAVGFDRLLMLSERASSIHDVLCNTR